MTKSIIQMQRLKIMIYLRVCRQIGELILFSCLISLVNSCKVKPVANNQESEIRIEKKNLDWRYSFEYYRAHQCLSNGDSLCAYINFVKIANNYDSSFYDTIRSYNIRMYNLGQ
jgi:hypothetical protein